MDKRLPNPLISSTFDDPVDDDGTYLYDCINISICPSRDLREHGCLLGSSAPRCPLEEKKRRRSVYRPRR